MRPDVPSGTALIVTFSILRNFYNNRLHGLVAEEDADLAKAVAAQINPGLKTLLKLGANKILRRVHDAGERLLLPGLSLHFSVRKHMIEQDVLRAIAEGFRQVVVVGAGFDGLASRLAAAWPDVHFCELDMPYNIGIKRKALQSLGRSPRNLVLHAVDLAAAALTEVLPTVTRFEPKLDTVFVVEGVLMYLSESQVSGLFAAIKALPCQRHRVVFTAVAKRGPGSGLSRGFEHPLFTNMLSAIGEPYRWGIRPGDLGSFLAARGYKLDHIYQKPEYAAALSAYRLGPSDFIDWELVAQADTH